MEDVVTLEKWLRQGSQRTAVVQVLRKPMLASEIHRAAQLITSRMQLRDLCLVLPQLMDFGLVECLTPKQNNGKVYTLTCQGRRLAQHAFGLEHPTHSVTVDWRGYSWVARARIRRLTVEGIFRLTERAGQPQTATSVRRFLRIEHSVGLNPVLRSLKELLRRGLIRLAGTTEDHQRWLYKLTPAGERIAAQLQR